MTRLHDLREFAQTWICRPLTDDDGFAISDEFRLPEALKDIYRTFGRVAALTSAHNRLLRPNEIANDGGYFTFYIENQGVVQWAYRERDAASADPIVYQGARMDAGLAWASEGMTLTAWMKEMALWQLVNGGYPYSAYSGGIADGTEIVAAHYPKLLSRADQSLSFYGSPGLVIAIAGPDSIPSIWAGVIRQDDFAAMQETLGIEWDYSSDDDQ